MERLELYTNDVDTVVAFSKEDAMKVYCEHTGEKDSYLDEFELLETDDDNSIGIYDDESRSGKTFLTREQWIKKLGRGFAWSTEY